MSTDEFTIQPYTHKELAARYHRSPKTFRRWLQQVQHDLGPRIGYSYTPKQVRIIVKHLGEP